MSGQIRMARGLMSLSAHGGLRGARMVSVPSEYSPKRQICGTVFRHPWGTEYTGASVDVCVEFTRCN